MTPFSLNSSSCHVTSALQLTRKEIRVCKTCQKSEKLIYAKVSQTGFDAIESIWRIYFVLFPTLYRADDRNVFYGKINMEYMGGSPER
jgi:hypothetical protein